jgi:simple sugar transport system ATP-binding protein
MPASTPTASAFLSLVFSGLCAAFAGIIYIAFLRSFNPSAGQLRELDAIAAVIIGGGSIFGGHGTVLGSLAGAAVIALMRALLSFADHPRRRLLLRHAAALGQRVHRPHPDHRRAGRHLGAPAELPRHDPEAWEWDDERSRRMPEATSKTPIIELRGINKAFGPGARAVDVNLVLYPGEVIGLVGDNSAGKSTLMKILTGAYQRDSGEILVNGEPVNFRSPHDSRDRGIEMIYQDFALCGNMNVAQNIFLGRWPRKGPFIDRKKMYADADEVLQRLKVNVNSVYQKVESLSGGRQQSVAIARAISFNPRVVILDEPTANLSVMATERLLETMLELKRQGVAQIIISHRLTDIFAVGDRVMVLKRGENVGDRYVKNTNEHEIWRSSSRHARIRPHRRRRDSSGRHRDDCTITLPRLAA